MIDLKELRIGNWINIKNIMNGSCEPEQFSAWGDYLDFETYGEPIPITEEILIKCGLEIKRGTPASSSSVYSDFYQYRLYLGEYNSLHLDAADWFPKIAEIKYLHQFQNIFFALTNKELNYTP